LRSREPGAKLAEAQLAVARRYGFASWRRLKAYVDALHDSGERLIKLRPGLVLDPAPFVELLWPRRRPGSPEQRRTNRA